MGLSEKVLEVMIAVDSIVKDKENKYHNYDYVSNVAVVKTIRDILVAKRMEVIPNTVDYKRSDGLSTVKMEFTLVDVDSGETRTTYFWGEGADGQDKGIYKAYTGAEKYFLLKTFLLPTLDDAEYPDSEVREKRNIHNNNQKEPKEVTQDPYGTAHHDADYKKYMPQKPLEWHPSPSSVGWFLSEMSKKGYDVKEILGGAQIIIKTHEGDTAADNVQTLEDLDYFQWKKVVHDLLKIESKKQRIIKRGELAAREL